MKCPYSVSFFSTAWGLKQLESKKVHAIFIVHNPGLQTRWFDDLICPLCAHYPSAIINSTSFNHRVNDTLNNKFYGLFIAERDCWRRFGVNRGKTTLATGLQTEPFYPEPLKTLKPKGRHHHYAEKTMAKRIKVAAIYHPHSSPHILIYEEIVAVSWITNSFNYLVELHDD